jgi:zinc transporter ZupT
MSPERFVLAVGVAVFAAGSLGLVLHRILPEKHITGGGKDVIGAVAGLLTLLCALVLGLLI